MQLTLALTLLPLLVSANRPVRMSAMRGKGPSSQGLAEALKAHFEANPPELVIPEIEGDPFDWDAYPECSKTCTPLGLEAGGCTWPKDVECMCRCPLFADPVSECEKTHCSQEDIDVIHHLGGKMCESVGGFRPKVPGTCKNKAALAEWKAKTEGKTDLKREK